MMWIHIPHVLEKHGGLSEHVYTAHAPQKRDSSGKSLCWLIRIVL